MTDRQVASQTDAYAEYEATLDALSRLPGILLQDLAAADAARRAALQRADAAAVNESTRLAALRRTTQSRYDAAAAELNVYGVPTPAQVRPAEGTGNATALRAAMAAHMAAVAGVREQLRQDAEEAQRSAEEADQQAAAAQRSAAALRSRQESLRQKREAAAEEARRDAVAASARRSWFRLLGGIGVLLLVSILAIIFSTQ